MRCVYGATCDDHVALGLDAVSDRYMRAGSELDTLGHTVTIGVETGDDARDNHAYGNFQVLATADFLGQVCRCCARAPSSIIDVALDACGAYHANLAGVDVGDRGDADVFTTAEECWDDFGDDGGVSDLPWTTFAVFAVVDLPFVGGCKVLRFVEVGLEILPRPASGAVLLSPFVVIGSRATDVHSKWQMLGSHEARSSKAVDLQSVYGGAAAQDLATGPVHLTVVHFGLRFSLHAPVNLASLECHVRGGNAGGEGQEITKCARWINSRKIKMSKDDRTSSRLR